MISGYEIITDAKVRHIVDEIIMGTRTNYDFCKRFVSAYNIRRKTNYLQNVSSNSNSGYAHYMIEMGYLNAFNHDEAVGKKLHAWYTNQMLQAYEKGYIQVFCLLYARSKPLFDKYGDSQEVNQCYFTVIMENYKDNTHIRVFTDVSYTYNSLSLYAEMVCKIIETWIVASKATGTAQVNPGYKEWLENEREFIEDVLIVNYREYKIHLYPNENDFNDKRVKMIKAIEKAQSLLK